MSDDTKPPPKQRGSTLPPNVVPLALAERGSNRTVELSEMISADALSGSVRSLCAAGVRKDGTPGIYVDGSLSIDERLKLVGVLHLLTCHLLGTSPQ